MSVKDWPTDDQPREKLLAKGASALSDSELLAIFLRTGIAGKDVVALSREVLAEFGTLTALVNADRERFVAIKGLGEAKFVQIKAVVELTRRALAESMRTKPDLSSPDAVVDYLRLTLAQRKEEVFLVLFLDGKRHLIASQEISVGSARQTAVPPRAVVQAALMHGAAFALLAHNHPSGDVTPSAADHSVTQKLVDALSVIDVTVFDHIIVGGDKVFRFSSVAMMPPARI